ncbi:hypothetical protein ACSTCQ_20795, partial [Klebsiella pneumoniae]
NGGKNSLNRLIRCVCGKKIGPDPRNFNQRVSLGRNDLLIRTFHSKTYPIASSIINSGGNLGGFVAPMAAGFLLDKTGSFNSVFTYFGICAAIGLVVILFLDEPQ